ncbi:hypothetical protein C1Y63_04835 [Corynebacterium sp. 13CS0277]|uniref:hypothetical protein n=1 Tax=Corynebacterium sp. 13CS0277 TaxID=2071994 RepID=UPI000D046C11|nr:hypothetical protein [Corynebacterium sp. 13CS0277]PRQ11737.1 hypothetical protein C1Y63_04835 [Corynebacterium sp. 13CS0277]
MLTTLPPARERAGTPPHLAESYTAHLAHTWLEVVRKEDDEAELLITPPHRPLEHLCRLRLTRSEVGDLIDALSDYYYDEEH